MSSAYRCLNPRCQCDSFDGHAGTYCCRRCENGVPCQRRCHVYEALSPARALPPAGQMTDGTKHQVASMAPPGMRQEAKRQPARCASRHCPCDSWNGEDGEYCCRTCRMGMPCHQRFHPFEDNPRGTAPQVQARRSHSSAAGVAQHRGNQHQNQYHLMSRF